jgi:hypothetical protein
LNIKKIYNIVKKEFGTGYNVIEIELKDIKEIEKEERNYE